MIREQQIKEASQKEMSKYPNFCITAPAFRMGAEWADAHPIQEKESETDYKSFFGDLFGGDPVKEFGDIMLDTFGGAGR